MPLANVELATIADGASSSRASLKAAAITAVCYYGGAFLVMSSGAKRGDMAKLAAAAGEETGKADAEFVRAATGLAIGGVAPVGHTGTLRTFVEHSLSEWPEVWAAAGHPNTVFALTYDELVRITRGKEVDVAA